MSASTIETMPIDCTKCGLSFKTAGARACQVKYQNCCTDQERFWMRIVKVESGCWLFQGFKDAWGYGHFKGFGKRYQAHRYAFEITHGKRIPAGKLVLHSCDNPPCVNPAHLRLGTNADNRNDSIARNRLPRGESIHTAKLTREQVVEIRALEGKATQRVVADKYGVSQTAVAAIFKRRSWKFL
jgi:hypothetical protein